MHENTSKIQLDLKSNINIGSINSRRPPESEPSIRNLVKPTSLSMCQFFVFHTFFKTTGFFPKQSFPGGEVSSFEQSMFQNSFYSSQSLYHISPIIIKIP